MKYLLSICAVIVAVTTTAHSAQASSYSTGNGASSRQLSFQELPNAGSGFYTLKYGGVQWKGTLGPLTATNGMGSVWGPGPTVVYSGNFTESTASGLQCSGGISLTRGGDSTNGYHLHILKQGNRNSGCGSRIDTEKFSMSESLPIANISGDFTSANSTTRFLQGGNFTIWPKWKVVDPDPNKLNCRATPSSSSSSSVTKFALSTVINVTGFDLANKWLKTSFSGTTCYVRANSTYLKPVQIPF